MAFCINCGEQLVDGARFCHACGNSVIGSGVEDKNKRKQEYVGKIYKCPNCGNIVNPSEAVCNSCGFQLSGKEAVGSAKDFQQKIMELEMSRRKKGFWDVEDETDKRILALVKAYPIPNNIEDILEFMHLAIGNIDVSISKKSFINWLDSSSSDHQLSNAWVAKMQQIYKKAELFFPDEPEFVHIKEVYFDMMEKLKLKQ